MFSEQQRDYIRQLVLTQKEYKYYVAKTNTNISGQGGNNANDINFTVYLSDKPFTANSLYSYSTNGNVLRCLVRGNNGNYNYHSQRVQWENGSTEISVENYEFIYTNANFSAYASQPDCLISNSVNQSHFDGFSIALLIILVSVIFSRMLRKGGSNGFTKI